MISTFVKKVITQIIKKIMLIKYVNNKILVNETRKSQIVLMAWSRTNLKENKKPN
ncbi:hypothetical protein CL6EHI_c00006 [Entamoeba histolytica]|uniref:Uncharacterized protein n=1 Tax=Entamoeba histolytica TaxID=5759 RepID=A0A175JCT6_ENTHI|nr:hypothetical protein CL6EHI_c00006 [Entamoeba histolytica]